MNILISPFNLGLIKDKMRTKNIEMRVIKCEFKLIIEKRERHWWYLLQLWAHDYNISLDTLFLTKIKFGIIFM